MRFLIILILSFMSIASSSVILNASAQDDTQIPDWIKNVAGWWATDEI